MFSEAGFPGGCKDYSCASMSREGVAGARDMPALLNAFETSPRCNSLLTCASFFAST